MRELKLASSGGFRKSAKISGDVMGITTHMVMLQSMMPWRDWRKILMLDIR